MCPIITGLAHNGILAMLGASCFFAAFDSLNKYLADFFTSSEIGFVRFGFGALVVIPSLFGRRLWVDKREISLLILQGVLGVGSFYITILAFRASTLSVTMVLFFTNPLWALLVGAYFLGERLTLRRSVGVLVALAGITILMSPWKGHISLGHLYGLLAGVMVGMFNVLIRYLRIRHNSRVIYGFFCLTGVMASSPLALWEPRMPELNKGILLITSATLGLMAHLTMNYGLRFIRAAEGATLVMTEVVLTSAIGIVLFRDPLTGSFMVGAVLIITSGIYLGLQEQSKVAKVDGALSG